MALSALDDLSAEPNPEQLYAALEGSADAWTALETWLTQSAGVDKMERFSSGKKYGWTVRAGIGKRNIVYLIPQHGSFLVGFVLGDRGMSAVRKASLSEHILRVISSARRYGEGTGFRLAVECLSDLDDIKTLVQIKIQH